MTKRARPPRRLRRTRPAGPTIPASSNLVKTGRLQRYAELLEKVQARKGLNPKEQAELSRYETERSGGPGPVPAGASVSVSTEAQLAEVYGVSTRTVQTWKAEPGWPGGERGPYALAVIGPWVRARWESEARAPAGSESDRARARRLNAMAEQAEMDLRQRRNELLPREDVWATWREFALAVQTSAEAFAQAHPAAVAEFHRLLESQEKDLRLRYPPAAASPETLLSPEVPSCQR